MSQLLFASNNAHKADEFREILAPPLSILTLKEAGITIEIPEPHPTLEENALEKARVIYALTGKDCFSEDTGLEVDSLNGAPGVHTARFAGPHASDHDNIQQLLKELKPHTNRSARFLTVICLIWKGKEFLFKGECEGRIAEREEGQTGFGYDPVFIPSGYQETFAALGMDVKKEISHRKKAAVQLAAFLNEASFQISQEASA